MIDGQRKSRLTIIFTFNKVRVSRKDDILKSGSKVMQAGEDEERRGEKGAKEG